MLRLWPAFNKFRLLPKASNSINRYIRIKIWYSIKVSRQSYPASLFRMRMSNSDALCKLVDLFRIDFTMEIGKMKLDIRAVPGITKKIHLAMQIFSWILQFFVVFSIFAVTANDILALNLSMYFFSSILMFKKMGKMRKIL